MSAETPGATIFGDPLAKAAYAEAVDDLARLLTAAAKAVPKLGPADAALDLTRGLLNEPRWGRLELASVLGVALERIHIHERAYGGEVVGWVVVDFDDDRRPYVIWDGRIDDRAFAERAHTEAREDGVTVLVAEVRLAEDTPAGGAA
jgi:hypothetical protein